MLYSLYIYYLHNVGGAVGRVTHSALEEHKVTQTQETLQFLPSPVNTVGGT